MPVQLREEESRLFEQEVKKYPWVAFCDEPKCYFIVSARDEAQGLKSLDIHRCPYGGSAERLPDKTLMSAMWRELDACMDGIMLIQNMPEVLPEQKYFDKLEHWKSRAGGIATCLFILLGGEPGYYPELADITREAVRRYRMRLGTLPWEPTQGDSYDALRDGPTPRWEAVVWEMRRKGAASHATITPPPNKSVPAPRPARKRRTAGTAPLSVPTMTLNTAPVAMPGGGLPGMVQPRKLADDVASGIRNALAAGMDASTIAGIFQVEVSVVESLERE